MLLNLSLATKSFPTVDQNVTKTTRLVVAYLSKEKFVFNAAREISKFQNRSQRIGRIPDSRIRVEGISERLREISRYDLMHAGVRRTCRVVEKW